MGIVQLQRAWYRPKRPVIHYVSNQRVLVRSRPAKVRNPRTQSQQTNRHKMSVASRFLSPLQPLVAHGFQAGARPNGRPVGSYHVALGHLLCKAMMRENGQWRINYKDVELAEGQRLKSFPVKVSRQGRTLRLRWEKGLPEGTQHIHLAFHNAKAGATECLEVKAPKRGGAVEVILPEGMRSSDLHMWWLPVVVGKTRWSSKYLFLPKSSPIVVGWVGMRGHLAAAIPTQACPSAIRPTHGKGGGASPSRGVESLKGG